VLVERRGSTFAALFDHINFLGRYAFALPESVAQGGLRPLRSAYAPETNDCRVLKPVFCSVASPNPTIPRSAASRPKVGQVGVVTSTDALTRTDALIGPTLFALFPA